MHHLWYKITMSTPESMPYWLLPLGAPPRVLQMGRGIHGSRPVERYRLEGVPLVIDFRERGGGERRSASARSKAAPGR